ncbi:DUF4406 domain-containing protein [Nocardioides sp. 503]|uniref:DUF4406 domain-containing protein n=1 Tax=Nocardioides sp. 503 TaxID=2508326 RepID=UPI001ADC19F1|nr:DUF4406 domain-containing protein [Nocardioides sp. 503]
MTTTPTPPVNPHPTPTLEELFTEPSISPMLVLVAGPYRSGTGDDPARLQSHVDDMNAAALELFQRGHVPLTGEAMALPLAALAGSVRPGDAAFDAIFHPFARRLLRRCDAVVRIGGPSAGADEMVQIARSQGAAIYTDVADVPRATR